MSDYDEHAPVFSGSGTNLVAEFGPELATPLFRRLPPGLMSSTTNLWRSNIPAIPSDGDILPAFRDVGSNGSTPSSHSSSLKASRVGLHDPPSVNISLSSSSGKRSMGQTFYKTDLDNAFELPHTADGSHVFKDDFMSAINLTAAPNQLSSNNIHGVVKSAEQEQRVGTGLGSGSNSPLDSLNITHNSNNSILNHDYTPVLDSGISFTSKMKTMTEENNNFMDPEQQSISEIDHDDNTGQIIQQGRSGNNGNNNSNNKREYLIIPQKTREQLIHMVCIDGMNVQSAVKQLNLKYSAAINIVRKFRDCGQLEIGPRGRRSKKVVSAEMRLVIAAILAERPKIEIGELRQKLKAKGINLPPSLIKDAAADILRKRDAEVY